MICSGRSGQMSKCERITQVAHDKGANVSYSLRSLRTNELMSKTLVFFLANPSFSLVLTKNEQFAQKIRKHRIFCTFLQFFCKFFKNAKVSLIPTEQSERITQVTQDKRATVSD